MSDSETSHRHSSAAIPLRHPVLTTTSKAHETTLAITLLSSHIPQLPPLQAQQTRAIVRMNGAYAEVCAGRLPLPDAEEIISKVMQEIEEIVEQVDDYILFWDGGWDMAVDGVAVEWNFVRRVGEMGMLERQRRRMLAEGVIKRVRYEGGGPRGEEEENRNGGRGEGGGWGCNLLGMEGLESGERGKGKEKDI